MAALNPLALHDLAETVLGCVCAALDAVAAEVEGQPGCPARACVVPGTPAWDTCGAPCDGDGAPGQLTVNYAETFPATAALTRDREVRGLRKCPPLPRVAAELVITLLRCAPGNSGPCPPSCEDLSAAARILHVDSTTVTNALLCCLPEATAGRRGPAFLLGAQRSIGPEGGCVGVEQRVTIAMPTCRPCPGDEVS